MKETAAPNADQTSVIALLRAPGTYPNAPVAVACHETHGAIVFVAGDFAYKIKRAVQFSYMDFSTVALRRSALERELELNRELAPDLYLDIAPICRDASGALHLGGPGTPIEWALRMRRFEQKNLLSAVVDRSGLTTRQTQQLADAVYESHRRAPPLVETNAENRVADIIAELVRDLRPFEAHLLQASAETLKTLAMHQFHRASPCLRRRGGAGFVRRCHGDLHLNNIVLWKNAPVLFDALEFNERLATTDTLYDLAFLLMDLEYRQHREAANRLLNRYVWRSADRLDIGGLIALPLFLSLRSAIRCLVTMQRAEQTTGDDRAHLQEAARGRMALALRYLSPEPPRLVAIGGLSGTGKTTLAASLASRLGPSPGALHLRTDLERKTMFGVAETHRLPPEAYNMDMSDKVYHVVLEKTDLALAAGQSVVVDAVYSKPEERSAVEAIAATRGVPFTGIWLTAPIDILVERVAARQGDASDATPAVVQQQLRHAASPLGWCTIDASGTADDTLKLAIDALKLLDTTDV
jgi:uncharacterized protein